MAESCDIVVVGGGMVGLAAAAALDDAGRYRVCVLDGGDAPGEPAAGIATLRVSALSPSSLDLLTAVGAWESANAEAQSFSNMRVWPAAGDPFATGSVHFAAGDLGVTELGIIIENARVRRALLAALGKRGIDVRFGQRVAGLARDRRGVTLALADGTTMTARLVVGADGANSAVRRHVAIPSMTKRYAQDALVLHVRTALAHDATAWQQFNSDGPMALLPLADGRCSVVRSAPPATVAKLRSLSDDELGSVLTAASNAALGELTPDSARAAFPLAAAQATAYAVERAVLIGDAAHRVHPLAGQGANLGFADVVALAATLRDAAARGDDPGDRVVLRAYERRRRGEARQTLLALDSLQRLFDTDSSALQHLRDTGMRWFDASPLVKAAAARAAMGLGGAAAVGRS